MEVWTEEPIGEKVRDQFTAYKCPRCGAPKTVRRDSFQPGLHQLTCRNCGFSSGDIQLKDNTVVEHDDTG
jgi:predicted RNA-binding Zn-ribbon protein involved in translation (DUF1610 family)